MNKPTKKQIRTMKALYTPQDVDALKQHIDRQWDLINLGIENDEDASIIADRIITIFGFVINEQAKIAMAYDPSAWERAKNDSEERDKDPGRMIFTRIHEAESDFAFGHAFHNMDHLITVTFNNIRSFMRQFPQYEEAIRTAWNAARDA